MTDTGRTRAERALAAVMAELHPGCTDQRYEPAADDHESGCCR